MCEMPEVMRESVQASRKPRRCCECGWPIESGERYHRTWGVWDGEPMTFVTCLRCIAARDEHLANLAADYERTKASYPRERPDLCWTYGDLYEDVTSCEWIDHGPEVTLLIARVQYRSERKRAELAAEARERWEDARDALIEAGLKLPLAKCSVCSEPADVGPGEPCPACACSETEARRRHSGGIVESVKSRGRFRLWRLTERGASVRDLEAMSASTNEE